MPNGEFNNSEEKTFADLNSPAIGEVKDLIDQLQHSHHLRSKLMNLEAWALAQTMDQFIPGFWSRFLENRRKALKQFLEQKRAYNSQVRGASSSPPESKKDE